MLLVPAQTRQSSPDPASCDLARPSTSAQGIHVFPQDLSSARRLPLQWATAAPFGDRQVAPRSQHDTSQATMLAQNWPPQRVGPHPQHVGDSIVNPWGGGAQLWGNALLHPNNCEREGTGGPVMGTSGAVAATPLSTG